MRKSTNVRTRKTVEKISKAILMLISISTIMAFCMNGYEKSSVAPNLIKSNENSTVDSSAVQNSADGTANGVTSGDKPAALDQNQLQSLDDYISNNPQNSDSETPKDEETTKNADEDAINSDEIKKQEKQNSDENAISNDATTNEDEGIALFSSESKGEATVSWKSQIKGEYWNKINKIIGTSDGGAVAVGWIYQESTNPTITTNGNKDALIIKYGKDGKIEWFKNYGGSEDDEFTDVVQNNGAEYYTVGTTTSTDGTFLGTGNKCNVKCEIDKQGNVVDKNVFEYGDIVLFESAGGYANSVEVDAKSRIVITDKSINDSFICTTLTGEYKLVGACENSGGYCVVLNFTGTLNTGIETISSNGSQDGLIIEFGPKGVTRWYKTFGASNNDEISGVFASNDLFVYGSYSTAMTIDNVSLPTPKGGYDVFLFQISTNGESIAARTFGGTQDDMITSAVKTSDESLLIGGTFYSASIDIDGDGTADITKVNNSTGTSQYFSDGYVAKLASATDMTSKLTFMDTVVGTSYETVSSVAETTSGSILAAGYFDSTTVDIKGTTGAFTSGGNTDAFVTSYSEVQPSPGVVVHHYIKGTTTPVPSKNGGTVADVTLADGNVGDTYTTTASDDIQQNFQLVTTPTNATGTYADTLTEVTYYYDYKTPTITSNVKLETKESAQLENASSVLSDSIGVTTLETSIADYIGNVEQKVMLQLPYSIDTSKSGTALKGGTYDEATKTITWTRTGTWNSYTNTGTFSAMTNSDFGDSGVVVYYKNIDWSKTTYDLKMTSTVTLSTPSKTLSSQDTRTTKQIARISGKSLIAKVVWEDNNDSLKIRPSQISARLTSTNSTKYQDMASVDITSSNNWQLIDGKVWLYNAFDKYNESGELINFTMTDITLGETLDRVYTATASNMVLDLVKKVYVITITCTYHAPENNTQNLVVNKVWDDNNNSAQKRPSNISFEVYQNGSETAYQTYKLNTATETSHTFQVAKYDAKGEEIAYSVGEKEVNANDLQFYKNTITNDGLNYTVTNKFEVPSGGKQITVEKKWDDNNNENNKRPASIKLIVQKEAKQNVADYTLNTATETSHTFELDKYDSNGNEISYIVDEQEVNADDLKFYSKAIKQDTTNTDKYIITNTFTVPGDTISVDANVKWVDNEIQAKRRPGSLILKVLNGTAEVNTQVVNNDSSWKTTFNDLPKYDSHGNEITYTIDQAEVTEGDMKFYKKTVSGYTITNTFTLPENNTQTIKTVKTWDDNNKDRLSKITLQLTGDGKTYDKTISNAQVDSTNANNWIANFDVPIYNANGEDIQYTLSEKEVNQGELNYYVSSVDNYNVKNTLIIQDSSITKTGPSTITDLDSKLDYEINYNVTLNDIYKDTATVTIVDTLPYKIDETKAYDLAGGKYDSTAKTITWKGTYDVNTNTINWENAGSEKLSEKLKVNKKISLVYKDIPIESKDTTITNKVQGKIELATGATNTKDNTFNTTTDFKVDVTVVKDWIGDSTTSDSGSTTITGRPDELIVQLLADGTLQQEVTLNTQNSWQSVIANLPKYNSTTRQTITYSINEANVPDGYYLSNTSDEETNGNHKFTITNSKYGKIDITKVDSKDQSIKLGGAEFKLEKLTADGKDVDTNFTAVTQTTSSETALLGTTMFTNLEYGKYRLTETKAPEGYHILKEPVEIEISAANVEQALTISDKLKPTLPATGGKGTVAFVTIGLLALGAFVTLRIKKKR